MRSPTSAFRSQVYSIVRAIPRGRVMTYGAIAALIPPPPGLDWPAYARIRARWVGYALADCPADVPWHRVVNAKGGISPRIGHGPHIQRILLEEEGVNFDKAHRLDLSACGWAPDADWRDTHGISYPGDASEPPSCSPTAQRSGSSEA